MDLPWIILFGVFALLGLAIVYKLYRTQGTSGEQALSLERYLSQQMSSLQDRLNQSSLNQHTVLNTVQEKLSNSVQQSLYSTQELLSKRLHELNLSTDTRLQSLTAHMHKTLDEGFVKNGGTLEQITSRLAVIDEAQRKISDLSSGILQLQDILSDKRARGAFGEVQLSMLLEDALPSQSFSLQHTLSNGTRVDCLLYLPAPCGPLAIDSKFPLENYQRSVSPDLSETERQQASNQFKQDLKKHISAIRDKYILPPETAHGAILFLPSEAVFAQVHSAHPDIIKLAHEASVWLASPSTLMAILTTLRGVLKDITLQEQAHKIRDELRLLAQEFYRYDERLDKLAKHFKNTADDFEDVMITGRKIIKGFKDIDQAELLSKETNT